MLKGLKILGILPNRGLRKSTLLVLVILAELLVLGWLTWLIFHNYPISDI
jgi:hypothetical protein